MFRGPIKGGYNMKIDYCDICEESTDEELIEHKGVFFCRKCFEESTLECGRCNATSFECLYCPIYINQRGCLL